MENMTGLLVALMFVTVLTMGFGNILSALTPMFKSPEQFFKVKSLKLWWVVVCLIILDAFWRCVDIFEFEEWNFAEFLLIIVGASLLFFASTALPEDDDEPDVRKVFFSCVLGYQIWILAIALLFGSPGVLSLICTGLLIAILVMVLRDPGKQGSLFSTVSAALLTVLSISL